LIVCNTTVVNAQPLHSHKKIGFGGHQVRSQGLAHAVGHFYLRENEGVVGQGGESWQGNLCFLRAPLQVELVLKRYFVNGVAGPFELLVELPLLNLSLEQAVGVREADLTVHLRRVQHDASDFESGSLPLEVHVLPQVGGLVVVLVSQGFVVLEDDLELVVHVHYIDEELEVESILLQEVLPDQLLELVLLLPSSARLLGFFLRHLTDSLLQERNVNDGILPVEDLQEVLPGPVDDLGMHLLLNSLLHLLEHRIFVDGAGGLG